MKRERQELFDGLRKFVKKGKYQGDDYDNCLIGQLYVRVKKQPEWQFIGPLIQMRRKAAQSPYMCMVYGVGWYYGVDLQVVNYIAQTTNVEPYRSDFKSAMEFAKNVLTRA